MDKHAIIRRDSAAFKAHCRKVTETLQHRDDDRKGCKAWMDACEAFHSFDSPKFEITGGDGLAALSAGDPECVDWAIAYLEVDPFHFRSGYHKSRFIRCLKRLRLTEE